MEISKRSIHLDFHTGPDIPGVGAAFDANEFARTMRGANVDGVTVFAMCHHGLLYYATEHPARHPGLPGGLDLMGEQIEALHSSGIRAPIYISAQCNEYAANEHPEWIALTPELRQVKRYSQAFVAGWQILDMSSPYRDYLTEIINEVLHKFAPVDGLFIDMCWDQPSCSKWAVDGMRKRGYDPREESDRNKYAREVSYGYMERYRDMLKAAQKEPVGVWFNSREKIGLNVEKKFLSHVEIESLPTGGWGYSYFPYISRYARPLGLPALSHTARFFKSWGDNCSLKPKMALKYELCQMLAQGIGCAVGDVLRPDGSLCAPAYELIGEAYGYIKSCEAYLCGMRPASQIALLTLPEFGDDPGPSVIGAMNALRRLRYQFDVVLPEHDLSGYELVIVPEAVAVCDELAEKLQSYVAAGGALILSGKAAFKGGRGVLPEQGVVCHGESPFTHTFIHAGPEVADGIGDYGHVMYERGYRATPGATGATGAAGTSGAAGASDAVSLAMVGEPYFERAYDRFCGHEYTPESHVSEYAAVIKNGRVITFAAPLFEAYGKHAAPNCRALIGNCIKLLIEPHVCDDGPSMLEVVLNRTGNTAAAHLICFSPERRAEGLDIVEDPVPVVGLNISVKHAPKPARVYLAPDGIDLPFTYENGRVVTTLTFLSGHAMLMIE